jgi:hypothetical protein
MERDNLTAKQLGSDGQSQYAVFLPALSGFYATYVGKQRYPDANGNTYVESTRVPANFENGIEGLNWLNPDAAYFPYHWSLYSAGHAELDVNKHSPKEDMVRNRDRSKSFILGDSGGFQIGKGVWEGDWKNPNCPKAQKKRELVLTWMDAYMDYGMCLDIPAWVARSPAGRKATGINTYDEAVLGTYINNDWFINNRTGACKFLNVLQGETHADADDWYERMKKYCDPKQYPGRHFNGWAMGGQNMCDVHLVLRRLVTMRFDGLLVEGLHDWMHFLGTSKLEWAVLLTDIQRAVRKYVNPAFTISFDCASPFLASANGQIYIQTETEDRGKWTYRMVPSVDNKKYATDARKFSDAVLQDGRFAAFTDSPVSNRIQISDVCYYKDGVRKTAAELNGEKFDVTNLNHYSSPPDLNKIGKVGRTSWDSFSYAIQMGHNVWSHINAVQEANRQYDLGKFPAMMHSELADKRTPRNYDGVVRFRDMVDTIFSINNRDDAMAMVDHYNKYFTDIRGTRGATGDATVTAKPMFTNLFGKEEVEEYHRDDSGLDETTLDNLEEGLGDE